MTAVALRPRSSTELVDAAIQLYKREPTAFITGVALIHVPWLVVRVVLGIGMSATEAPTVAQVLVVLIGTVCVYTLAGGVTTLLTRDVYFDRPVDLGRSFRDVAVHLAPLVSTMIVVGFFVTIGLFLFVLPALYPLARFFCVRQAILLEDAGTGRALSRSSELSAGLKRHVINTLLLVLLVTIAVSVGAAFVTSGIPSLLLRQVIQTVVAIVLYPAFGITETLLYYDARIRKEGFDVEYLASTTTSAGAVA